MVQIPHGPDHLNCPLTLSAPLGPKKMSKVCHTCPLWTMVRGKNPNTGEDVDRWDCSLALAPMLMIENAQQARQAGAAVESMRNEMVKESQATRNAIVKEQQTTRADAQQNARIIAHTVATAVSRSAHALNGPQPTVLQLEGDGYEDR